MVDDMGGERKRGEKMRREVKGQQMTEAERGKEKGERDGRRELPFFHVIVSASCRRYKRIKDDQAAAAADDHRAGVAERGLRGQLNRPLVLHK